MNKCSVPKKGAPLYHMFNRKLFGDEKMRITSKVL